MTFVSPTMPYLRTNNEDGTVTIAVFADTLQNALPILEDAMYIEFEETPTGQDWGYYMTLCGSAMFDYHGAYFENVILSHDRFNEFIISPCR